MGWPALVIMAVGAIVSAKGKQSEGKAQSYLYKQNAQLAGYQAEAAIQEGERNVAEIQRARNQIIGEQRAHAGGSGLLVNQGSALDAQVDTAVLAEEDIMRARYNAKLAAWGYQVDQSSYKYQAKLAKKAGQQAAIGGLLSSAGSFYGTSSSFGGGGGG